MIMYMEVKMAKRTYTITGIAELQDYIAEKFYGEPRSTTHCINCKSTDVKASDFRDELSRREFAISGFCQRCQDEVFGGE